MRVDGRNFGQSNAQDDVEADRKDIPVDVKWSSAQDQAEGQVASNTNWSGSDTVHQAQGTPEVEGDSHLTLVPFMVTANDLGA